MAKLLDLATRICKFGWSLVPKSWEAWTGITAVLALLVAIATLMATIAVALFIHRLDARDRAARDASTKAGLGVSTSLHRSADGTWFALVDVWNNGPAATTPLRIDFTVGGDEVRPRQLISSTGSAIQPFALDKAPEGCAAARAIVRVDEPLLVSDVVHVRVDFDVDSDRDLKLQDDGSLASFDYTNDNGEHETYYGSESKIMTSFVQRVTATGDNIQIQPEVHSGCYPEG